MKLGSCIHLEELRSTLCLILRLDLKRLPLFYEKGHAGETPHSAEFLLYYQIKNASHNF